MSGPHRPPLGDIQAITLDFYNTLVYHRTGRGRGAMLMEYLQTHQLESDSWEHHVLYDVFEPHGVEYDPRSSREERQRYYDRLAGRVFRRLNVRAPEGTATEHALDLWQILGPASLGLFPEVPEALHRLKTLGFPLAVVSNWQCGLRHFCTELGITDGVDHVVASAEVGAAKPDPAIFREACRRLAVPPRQALHVGDSFVDDLEGGRAAGLQVVLLRRDRQAQHSSVPTVADLRQLVDLPDQMRTP